MRISGFQKMTLLDFPGKVACTLFTCGCNFRCGFCHNASLVTHINSEVNFTEEEILQYLKKRQGLLEGVCITGGEPLMQPDITEFIIKIKKLGYSVKLDTNGSFPEKLKDLIEQKLVDYVAMDIKNSKEKYCKTVNAQDLDLEKISKSIELLLEGKVDFEFRTTVVNELHTKDDIVSICNWIKGAPKYFLQNFEDSGDLISTEFSAVSKEELFTMQEVARNIVENTGIRGL